MAEIRNNRITCEDVKENPITLRIEAAPGKMLRKNIQKVPKCPVFSLILEMTLMSFTFSARLVFLGVLPSCVLATLFAHFVGTGGVFSRRFDSLGRVNARVCP